MILSLFKVFFFVFKAQVLQHLLQHQADLFNYRICKIRFLISECLLVVIVALKKFLVSFVIFLTFFTVHS